MVGGGGRQLGSVLLGTEGAPLRPCFRAGRAGSRWLTVWGCWGCPRGWHRVCLSRFPSPGGRRRWGCSQRPVEKTRRAHPCNVATSAHGAASKQEPEQQGKVNGTRPGRGLRGTATVPVGACRLGVLPTPGAQVRAGAPHAHAQSQHCPGTGSSQAEQEPGFPLQEAFPDVCPGQSRGVYGPNPPVLSLPGTQSPF